MYNTNLRNKILGFGLLLMFVFSLVAPAHAQSGAGSIQGTVSDATGAIIHGAKVEILNVANGTTIESVSNGSGFYSVPG